MTAFETVSVELLY